MLPTASAVATAVATVATAAVAKARAAPAMVQSATVVHYASSFWDNSSS